MLFCWGQESYPAKCATNEVHNFEGKFFLKVIIFFDDKNLTFCSYMNEVK